MNMSAWDDKEREEHFCNRFSRENKGGKLSVFYDFVKDFEINKQRIVSHS